jgi:hypothetical protein
MRFLADEGVDRQIVEKLRTEGHDVLYIAEIDAGIRVIQEFGEQLVGAFTVIQPGKVRIKKIH